jgi:hypothetical protein
MILVNLPIQGRNPNALRTLRQMQTGGLGWSYLNWVVRRLHSGTLPDVDVQADDRISTNFAQLAIGWELASMFSADMTGQSLPAPDWSLARESIVDASRHDPVAEAVRWAKHQEFYGGARVAWIEHSGGRNGCLFIRVENLVREVNRAGQHILPGGYKAIENDLRARFNAVVETHEAYGKVIVIPPDQAARLLGGA